MLNIVSDKLGVPSTNVVSTRGKRQARFQTNQVQPLPSEMALPSGIDLAVEKCKYYFNREFTGATERLQMLTKDNRQFGLGMIGEFSLVRRCLHFRRTSNEATRWVRDHRNDEQETT